MITLLTLSNKGDKVRIDTEKSLVSINGASAINLKDLFSDYPKINKGQNKLEIMPANIGKAKVIYRRDIDENT